MKIVILSESVVKDNKTPVPSFYSKADSTLLKGGKPFFIPDFVQQCGISIHLVARTSRLGKGFSVRHAYRYVDAWTLGATFTALDMLSADGLVPSCAVDFDGSTMIGDFIMKEDIDLVESKCQFLLGDDNRDGISLNGVDNMIYDSVSRLSWFFTWKQGDLLFSAPLSTKKSVKVNEHISCKVNNQLLLDFNIK